jgi:hypothetical protein
VDLPLLLVARRGLLSFIVTDQRTDAQKYEQDRKKNYEKSSQTEAVARAKPAAERKGRRSHIM